MQKKPESGKYYHIYNHTVGGRDLFREPENYDYFLSIYNKHISPVAETFAWVLMPNHFHLLIRIKEKKDILESIHLTGIDKQPEQKL